MTCPLYVQCPDTLSDNRMVCALTAIAESLECAPSSCEAGSELKPRLKRDHSWTAIATQTRRAAGAVGGEMVYLWDL